MRKSAYYRWGFPAEGATREPAGETACASAVRAAGYFPLAALLPAERRIKREPSVKEAEGRFQAQV